MERVFLTGANRGIGLAFARQLAGRGSRVFAACRRPDQAVELNDLAAANPNLTILQLDVTDLGQIDRAYNVVREELDGLDILINNAGVYDRRETFGELDPAVLEQAYRVNTIAPLMIAQRFIDLLRAGDRPRIINITSRKGSLTYEHNRSGYSYSSSKTALNMITRMLAQELAGDGIVPVVFHPGWVRTGMGGSGAPLTPGESVRGMLSVIDRLTQADAGRFYNYDGSAIPW